MFGKKKRLEEIDKEMDFIVKCMRKVSPESKEYRDLQNRYATFLKMREDLCKPVGVGKVVGSIFEGFIRAAGTIGVPIWLAHVAYNGDEELKLVNQRSWNLIGKRTDK